LQFKEEEGTLFTLRIHLDYVFIWKASG